MTIKATIRVDKKCGEVMAFWYVNHNLQGYAHECMHFDGSYEYYKYKTRPATDEEAQELIQELQYVGYNLEVKKRLKNTN